MVGAIQLGTIAASLRAECGCSTSGSNYGNPDDFLPRKSQNQSTQNPNHLSLSKPALIVRTESNVRRMSRRKPKPFCVVCEGSGRVDCHDCSGKGRTNCTELMMLPTGEWPKWCKTCGGSGLAYCSRCLGTGEYRDIMGFHFMKMEGSNSEKHMQHQTKEKPNRLTAADLLLSESSSETEL